MYILITILNELTIIRVSANMFISNIWAKFVVKTVQSSDFVQSSRSNIPR